MRVLVFQHIACEHPGIFRDFLKADGISYDAVELDEGEPIPSLAQYGALWVMGGPMDIWEEEQHPWLIAEKAAIREAVLERRLPYFGLCLGHQLLAAALGGEVGKMAAPEIGLLGVDLTEAGRTDPLICHGTRLVTALRNTGDACWHPTPMACNIMSNSPTTVPEWGDVPAYACALDETLGAGALKQLRDDAAKLMPESNRTARQFYDNFRGLIGNAARAAQ